MKPLLLLDLSKLTLAERLKLYTDGYDTLTAGERYAWETSTRRPYDPRDLPRLASAGPR